MKTFGKTLIVAALAVLISSLSASVNAQVVVTIQQPPPGQLNVEDLWNLDLTNNTQETFTVHLRGTATEERDGLIFDGSSNTFSLPPGFRRVNPTDITIDLRYSNRKYEDIVLRTGSVSEGDYTVCIYVINVENGEELGRGCIQQQVAHPSPPQLISPKDGATVEDEFPVFSWMPPMPLLTDQIVSYNLKIVEILSGQTPIDAMQSSPSWFEEEGILQTSFRYPISARVFEPGKEYAWQVQTLDSDGTPIGENEGKSEIQYFGSVHPDELYRNYLEEWTWYFNDLANELERQIERLEKYLGRYTQEEIDSLFADLKAKIEGLKAQLKDLEKFLDYLEFSDDSDEDKMATIGGWFWTKKMMREWEDRYKFEHPDPSDYEDRLLFFREQTDGFNRAIEDVIDHYEQLELVPSEPIPSLPESESTSANSAGAILFIKDALKIINNQSYEPGDPDYVYQCKVSLEMALETLQSDPPNIEKAKKLLEYAIAEAYAIKSLNEDVKDKIIETAKNALAALFYSSGESTASDSLAISLDRLGLNSALMDIVNLGLNFEVVYQDENIAITEEGDMTTIEGKNYTITFDFDNGWFDDKLRCHFRQEVVTHRAECPSDEELQDIKGVYEECVRQMFRAYAIGAFGFSDDDFQNFELTITCEIRDGKAILIVEANAFFD